MRHQLRAVHFRRRLLSMLRPDVPGAHRQQSAVRLLQQHRFGVHCLRLGLQVLHLLQWVLSAAEQHLCPLLQFDPQLCPLLPECNCQLDRV